MLRATTKPRLVSWTILLVLLEFIGTNSVAQERVIPSDRSCARCRIHIHKIAELPPGARAQATLGSRVVRNRVGLFFVAPTVEQGVIAMHDAEGRFLRAVGRRGGGPGEFDDITALAVSPADSLYVLHRGNRFSVLGPDATYARSFASPLLISRAHFGVDREGRVVVAEGSMGAPGGILSLHRIGAAGELSRTVRADALGPAASSAYGPLAITAGGDLFASPRSPYVMDRFDRAGRWQARFVRELSWFPREWDRRRAVSRPVVNAITARSDGRIWVSLLRPNRNWVPPEVPPKDARGETAPVMLTAPQAIDRFDHVLELFDPATGRIVASAQITDRYVGGFLDGEHLYTHREEENGEITIEIWRLSLVQPFAARADPS